MGRILAILCVVNLVSGVHVQTPGTSGRESRKLFGGYRITPRYCQATRKPEKSLDGPNICMFNHECSQRNGQVVGACMDGFLFGACCQIPATSIGDLLDSEISLGPSDNTLSSRPASTPRPQTSPIIDITSSGVSQITQSLLGALPTAPADQIVQLNKDQTFPSTTLLTHLSPETEIQAENEIPPGMFTPTEPTTERKTTFSTSSPSYGISISNAPLIYTQKPMFIKKPSDYVLVPTITHNKKPEYNSVVNIIEILNSTTKKPPSTSYVYSSTFSTRRPDHTSKPPPSTSFVFSSTIPPRRTTTKRTTTKKQTKPTRKTKPQAYSTLANSPTAFTSTRPPSTSYVYSPTPTRRPTVDTHIAGPGFSVTSRPPSTQYTSSSFPSPPPTVIVLSPLESESTSLRPSTYQSPSSSSSASTPQRKPINSVTINNHVTQNIYATSPKPSPTVLITPKPNIAKPEGEEESGVGTSANDLINFPPVRNPNLNMSIPNLGDDDITTPSFVEDDALNEKMESFVNNIIQGLQEPFEGLKDVVYNRNKTVSTTKKPLKKQGTTTKKPVKVTTTTKKPVTRRTTTVGTRKPSTTVKRKTTKKPVVTTTVQSFIEEASSEDVNDEISRQCGVRPLLKSGRIVGGKGATFGEFPWQVLVRESTWLGLFTKNKCGGVLIGNKYVMTAAHCQPGFLASLVAVMGEFDISGDLESKRPISRNVKRVIVHREYDAATFENDLALLELEHPVQFDAHIVPICLPREGEDFTGRMATVTGWGRLKYTGGVPSVLQEVQVPIMENHVCQEMFRTAGHAKVILESFLCAGYANGQKDSCEGDSGGPLVLQRPDGRYQLAGTVSHGIKCAAPYLPGVYMRTTYYKPWITSITGIN